MTMNTYNVVVPTAKSYDVVIGTEGITFGNSLPQAVTALTYSNNDQQLGNDPSTFVDMTPSLTPTGATGKFKVTIGTLPSFLSLNEDTGVISYTSGTGNTNFEFVVTFTASGLFSGTFSFQINAGVMLGTFLNLPIQHFSRRFTPAEIIAAGVTPITLITNPDPVNNFFYLLSSIRRTYFNTTPYSPDPGSFIDFSIYQDRPESLTSVLTIINLASPLIETKNEIASNTSFPNINIENTDPITSEIDRNRRRDILMGTPNKGAQIDRPVGGDSDIEVELFYVWFPGNNLIAANPD